MLLVLAWSSVSFNLPAVYKPVMQALFASQPEPGQAAARRRQRHNWTGMPPAAGPR
jgi:hypothetical protein